MRERCVPGSFSLPPPTSLGTRLNHIKTESNGGFTERESRLDLLCHQQNISSVRKRAGTVNGAVCSERRMKVRKINIWSDWANKNKSVENCLWQILLKRNNGHKFLQITSTWMSPSATGCSSTSSRSAHNNNNNNKICDPLREKGPQFSGFQSIWNFTFIDMLRHFVQICTSQYNLQIIFLKWWIGTQVYKNHHNSAWGHYFLLKLSWKGYLKSENPKWSLFSYLRNSVYSSYWSVDVACCATSNHTYQ